MGASSGKLVITENNAAADQPTDGNAEAVNQTKDGVGPDWDFQPIDEPEEAPTTLVNGHAESEQTGADGSTTEGHANGDVSTAEPTTETVPEKAAKKHKNSLIRIPSRLSKINFSFNFGKKRSKSVPTKDGEGEQPAAAAAPEEAVESKPDESAIVGVADSLVDEVITSATAVHTSTLEEQKETTQAPEITNVTEEVNTESQPPAVVESFVEPTPEVQEAPQQTVDEVPVINNKEEIILNGDHETNEQITNHVLDSNNTNSENFEHVNGDSHPPTFDNDAIISKLNNLELSNGHSEVAVAVNGHDQ